MASAREQYGLMVRRYRERANLTQEELAGQIERGAELIGRIERGTASPSFETIERIARALKKPIRDFFGVGPYSVSRDDPLAKIVAKLAKLSDRELKHAENVLTAHLSKRD